MHLTHILVPLSLILSCSQQPATESRAEEEPVQNRRVGGPCECCEGMYEHMPDFIASDATLCGEEEPGERLRISGRILDVRGRPAEGVILYIYHTNAEGIYLPSEGQRGCARRHGRLRGWVKSDAQGRYAFNTILPGSYPNTQQEKHIHPVIKEPDKNEYWIDAFVFDSDPFLTEAMRQGFDNRGGSGLIKLKKNENGVWMGTRDIVLGKNVVGY